MKKRALDLLEWYEALVFALVLFVVGFSFLFRIILVNGSSMHPTLEPNDRLIIHAAGYQPQRGDVIVLDAYIDYVKPLVKRIIALGGDTVDIDAATGTVSVNGQALQEDYIAEPIRVMGDVEFPLVVPDGTVFVLGDNRNGSTDSRDSDVGCVDARDVLGKAVFRISPFDRMGVIQ
ncbi:MAG: signal peptidase I [Faecalibacterium sp.]|nr:signal peptidase I [Faecalibacterium sp.]